MNRTARELMVPGKMIPGMGGAMDLVRARRVIVHRCRRLEIVMLHTPITRCVGGPGGNWR
jgi:acyl CoA:acetate/3-ketoacid CoA transferase beta subunit